jgi:hypothetical protein
MRFNINWQAALPINMAAKCEVALARREGVESTEIPQDNARDTQSGSFQNIG